MEAQADPRGGHLSRADVSNQRLTSVAAPRGALSVAIIVQRHICIWRAVGSVAAFLFFLLFFSSRRPEWKTGSSLTAISDRGTQETPPWCWLAVISMLISLSDEGEITAGTAAALSSAVLKMPGGQSNFTSAPSDNEAREGSGRVLNNRMWKENQQRNVTLL